MALKDNYVTITEAAKKLGVTRQTISRWIAKKYVPVERVGRAALIKKKDLQKYQQRKLSEAAADSIMKLYTATIYDIFQEEGRIKPGYHVEFAEDGDDNVIHLSNEEKAKVDRAIKPMLVEILTELDSRIKNKQQNKKGGKRKK